MTPRRLLALTIAASLALSACGDAPADRQDPDAGTATAVIQTFRYEPPTLRVETGATVRWENRDEILHTVTSGEGRDPGIPGVSPARPPRPTGVFDGQLDGADSTFEFTFGEPGTYRYFCRVHSGMAGTVVVA